MFRAIEIQKMFEVGEVVVFFAPKQQRWVLRPFGTGFGLALGDRWAPKDTEPTDEEIRAMFGDVKIRRGYHTGSEWMERKVAERIGEVLGSTPVE